jgi:hypothetical protein
MLTGRPLNLLEKKRPDYSCLNNPYTKLAGHDEHQNIRSTMAEKILERIDSICYWKERQRLGRTS